MTASKTSLAGGIAKLFNSDEFADVNIHIGEHEFAAHAVVLAGRSPFFQKALSGNFREGQSRHFLFKEGSPHAHWRVFEYTYTDDYTEEPAQVLDAHDDDELVKDVRLLADCIREIYASTTESAKELRSAVIEIGVTHRAELWKKKAFRDLIREGGDFVVDLTGRFSGSVV
ncbi:BTB/POZ domain-containing protein [Xylariaceae sp. FL0255]|nr:BTB/POZ domain-containing protein [Xylariaceae sp. FL0255]